MSLGECITVAEAACLAPSKVIGQVEVGTQFSLPLADKSVGCSFKAERESRSVQTIETVDQSSSTSGLTNAMSLGVAEVACLSPSKVIGQVEVGLQCTLPLTDKSVGCSFKAGTESRSVQTTESLDQSSSTSVSRPSISPSAASSDNSQQGCLHQCRLCDYETDKLFRLEEHSRVHTGECLFKCHLCLQSFSRKYNLNRHLFLHTGQRPFICHVCSQCFSLKAHLTNHLHTHTGEKSFQCPSCPQSFLEKSKLKEHLCTHTGLTNAMSLGECITIAKEACPTPSKVVIQVEVGLQCSLPLADKSVGCSLKAWRESRSVQTTEAVDQSSSTSASRPSISPSTANSDTSQQGGLHQDHLCDYETDKLLRLEAHAKVHTGECLFKCHLCSRSFSRRDRLKRHLLVHTGLTNAMSLFECITVANAACPAPSKVVGQVEVGLQCSLPLADKSVGCSFKAGSKSRSVQTTEAVDQSSFTSGLPGAEAPSQRMSGEELRENIKAFYFSINSQ
ncbi:zinc finger protein 675-like [Dermacentor silvarum]|uniref:zinc finger protein 675-like n=1 Tax=Dermacentor silvarum TaxID=543639 RepID=UPI002101C9D1|nr:zinc finger protein 675-like [Dermacentor silvarum]